MKTPTDKDQKTTKGGVQPEALKSMGRNQARAALQAKGKKT